MFTVRCKLHAGDFPAVLAFSILLAALSLFSLTSIRRAMNPGGRVVLVESIILPGNEPDFGKIIDLEMLLLPGGRERTGDEFRALFARAGFKTVRIIPTRSPLSVIEAR